MKCKCPSCHATGSLEMFTNDEASQAFVSVLNLTGELAKPLIKYLGLFRSENRDLSFSRTAKLINEIAPDIVAGQISRNRISYPAPKKAWIWAINIMLERREQGLLQLPLKTHGYLYEVISSYKPDEQTQTQTQHHGAEIKPKLVTEPSRYEREMIKRQQAYADQQMIEHERQKHEPISAESKEMLSFINKMRQPHEVRTLKGIPVEQLPAYLRDKRKQGETLEECYQRLKKREIEAEAKAKANQPTETNL